MVHVVTLLLGFLVFATAALAEPVTATRPRTELVMRDWSPDDKEMFDIATRVIEMCQYEYAQPCSHLARFDGKQGPMFFDSDRMAKYLIGQWQESSKSPYHPEYGIFEYLAHTQSKTAFDFLKSTIETDSSLKTQKYALRGLVYSNDPKAVDVFLKGLREDALNPLAQRNARLRMVGIQKNLEVNGRSSRAFEDELKALDQDGALDPKAKRRAHLVLEKLAEKDLLVDRAWRPANVKFPTPSKPIEKPTEVN